MFSLTFHYHYCTGTFSVPAIWRGPVNTSLIYNDHLTVSFSCNAFGGDEIELDFVWSTTSSSGLNDTSETRFIDPMDNSTTSEIHTNILSVSDRGSVYMCRVRYADATTLGNPETATIISIGKWMYSYVPKIINDTFSSRNS